MTGKTFRWIFISIFSIAFFTCCKKDKPCKKPAPVFFTMSQMVLPFGGWRDLQEFYVEVDSAAQHGGNIYFEAYGEYDSLLWKVGADKREWRSKKFSLDFGEYIGPVDIHLVAWHTVDKECFPDDDGVDTIVKTLVMIPREDLPLWGAYEGKLENHPDSSMTIVIIESSSQIEGIQKCPNNFNDVSVEGGFHTFALFSSFCNAPYGIGYLNKDKVHLKLDYYTLSPDRKTKQHWIFTGQRKK